MNEMKVNTAYISTVELVEYIEAAVLGEVASDRAEELENELLELKAKLAEYAHIDQWLAANPYYAERLAEWKRDHGLDEQAAEIERLQGENEELRRGMDELGAQVEYWRLKAEKAGVDDDKME